MEHLDHTQAEIQKGIMAGLKEKIKDKHLKYLVTTFGCQMNLSDSEKIKTMLNEHGFIEIKDEKESDIVVINTCSVREAAENRVFGLVENLHNLKKKNKNNKPLIIVTGCMPGRDHKNEIRSTQYQFKM